MLDYTMTIFGGGNALVKNTINGCIMVQTEIICLIVDFTLYP